MQPGEALHKAGDDGARAMKRWLESTTRVKTVWINTDGRHAARMTFKWPADQEPFSFDLGGMFHLGEYDGDIFGAECKNYSNNNNHQDSEFRSFLGKCYVVENRYPGFYNHYLWITRHPFSVTSWSTLTTPEYINRGVLQESRRIFGCADEEAKSKVDTAVVQAVSEKLWQPIVLSKEQEKLVITPENRRLIYGNAAEEGSL